jgi:predicted deacetylase
MPQMSNPQYLLRFDDICPTMNWRVWAEIESVLIQREIKPILAVVPDNQDPGLQVDSPVGDFWNRVRTWQDRGWTISLHGFQHRYVSRNAGLVAIRKKSEFAGLSAGEQREKLRRGVEILEREGMTPRVWIAPGNTFDATTVALLPEFGIRIICDGYFRFPYVCPLTSSNGERMSEKGWITWVPQQLFYFRPAPSGVWTVCYHHNEWTASQTRKFRKDVDDYGANIASLKDVLSGNATRVCKWSEWICTHPRLSRFLIRSELKLWSWCAGRRRLQSADMNAVQLPR